MTATSPDKVGSGTSKRQVIHVAEAAQRHGAMNVSQLHAALSQVASVI
jgi:hypothetical protein